tara:strand:+ start:16832 stop:17770 length:939 start_codon:yes stop_codon:yes gene_type:complete
MEHIKHFKELNKEHVAVAGGKGASLGEMFNAGVNVPEGFVVTAQAYKEFVKDIQPKIIEKLQGLDVENNEQLDKISAEIRELILSQEVSPEMKKLIIEEYEKMGSEFVAIRSSATAEDLPEASFAGQQDTHLNVKGNEDVVNYVVKCFSSLFTSRAMYYREKNNFKHEDVHLAVVVQKMVNSDKAGVMFTVNPVTNNEKEKIIEGAFGLGELVVSGQITPDSYIVDKDTLKAKDINIGSKSKGMFRGPDGKNFEKETENPESQVLNDAEIEELSKLGLQLEKHYNFPQDIEWAIEDGKIYIVQSRPVTTFKK